MKALSAVILLSVFIVHPAFGTVLTYEFSSDIVYFQDPFLNLSDDQTYCYNGYFSLDTSKISLEIFERDDSALRINATGNFITGGMATIGDNLFDIIPDSSSIRMYLHNPQSYEIFVNFSLMSPDNDVFYSFVTNETVHMNSDLNYWLTDPDPFTTQLLQSNYYLARIAGDVGMADGIINHDNFSIQPVPEPATVILLIFGFLCIGLRKFIFILPIGISSPPLQH